MARSTAELEIADLAAGQWGLFTTAQARRVGLSAQQVARLAESGAAERLQHGVYRISGVPTSPVDDLRAAWLALQPTQTADERLRQPQTLEVVSHRSAAAVHRLGDVDADLLEFTTPTRKQSRRADVRFHRGELGLRDWTLIDGLPVTIPLVTIRDLAAAHLDSGHLAGVLRDALTRDQVGVSELVTTLRPYARRYGAPLGDGEALLQRLIDEAGVPETTREVARRADPASHLLPPGVFEAVQSPGLQEAIRAMQSPALQEAIRTLQSPALQEAIRLTRSAGRQIAAQNALRTVRFPKAGRASHVRRTTLPQAPRGRHAASPPPTTGSQPVDAPENGTGA
jgi:hypothetical protein